MLTFKIHAFDKKQNKFVECNFICKRSKAKHEKLKSFANGANYWFKDLTGANWHRGGFYDFDFGFINASPNLLDNVQGVVYKNEVYILKKIELC